ncbi:hypothetical protein LIER_34998 [Lithospermum erythrorhizon]|uniref:Nucleoside phosphorylase domain-containing protein n=1 Tax=Lithospermum erythrorhizon TaxID=34254 RepID=A0AAV3NHV5_LITER
MQIEFACTSCPLIVMARILKIFTSHTHSLGLIRLHYFKGEKHKYTLSVNKKMSPFLIYRGGKREERSPEGLIMTISMENKLGEGSMVARPISNIVFIIAMQTEALPLVNKFELTEDPNSLFPKNVPWVRYNGKYKDLNVNIVCPGKDAILGVDSVGTVSAALLTYASIQALKPDLIINAGTAGAFKAKGASIGDVYLASDVAFHDRRIPIPVFDLYGVGLRQACCTPNVIKALNLKVGKLSTGDSLDMCPLDEASIMKNDAVIKDMEGAAVAYVADLLKVSVIFLKAVTDIVDGDKPTAEEFLQNLAAVTAALDEAATKVVDFINGKCLSEL